MEELDALLQSGKARTYCTEWGDKVPAGFYENICGLLNAFGGDVYIGINEDGSVTGLDAARAMELGRTLVQDFIDGKHIMPGFWAYIREPLYIAEDGTLCNDPHSGKAVLHLYIPMSGNMHSSSRRIYDRTESGNRDITDDGVALLHLRLRKSGEHTELRPVHEATWEDLDTETIHRMRDMAVAKRQDHPWREWEDEALVSSLRLVNYDSGANEKSYTLGALLLFGKDESIARLLPRYGIDMVLRSEDGTEKTERIACNLFKAYDRLMEFAHENISRCSEAGDARALDNVLRNLVVNFLVHREYASPLPARFIISPDSVSTENGHDAEGLGEVTQDFMPAYPDRVLFNMLLKAFGEAELANRFNTGLREIAKNSGSLSARPPVFIEGNTFRATVYTA